MPTRHTFGTQSLKPLILTPPSPQRNRKFPSGKPRGTPKVARLAKANPWPGWPSRSWKLLSRTNPWLRLAPAEPSLADSPDRLAPRHTHRDWRFQPTSPLVNGFGGLTALPRHSARQHGYMARRPLAERAATPGVS